MRRDLLRLCVLLLEDNADGQPNVVLPSGAEVGRIVIHLDQPHVNSFPVRMSTPPPSAMAKDDTSSNVKTFPGGAVFEVNPLKSDIPNNAWPNG